MSAAPVSRAETGGSPADAAAAWISDSAEATERAGEALGALLEPSDLVLLGGPLGAGKTRLAAGAARGAGAPGPVRSPTFTLVNHYRGRIELFHVDLYRIEGGDWAGLGLEESLERGAVLVEWGEKLPLFLAREALSVILTPRGGDRRRIEAVAAPGRAAALLRAWQPSLPADAEPR